MTEMSQDAVYNIIEDTEPVSFPDLLDVVQERFDLGEDEVSHELSEHLSKLIDRNEVSVDIDWRYRIC